MRHSHTPAPLHRIEQWNGSYFRPASLWEVGTYLLVPHHDKEGLCATLQFQKTFLERQQLRVDEEEQTKLRNNRNNSGTTAPDRGPTTGAGAVAENQETDEDANMSWRDEANADAIFEAELDNMLHNNSTTDNIWDENPDSEDAATDIHMEEYLGPFKESLNPNSGPVPGPDIVLESGSNGNSGSASTPELGPDNGPDSPPTADGLNNGYVRVVHTNGIHHIGLVYCSCNGHDKIVLDLFASRLLPTSFVRIRSIFMAQLMDRFRLCNLELKASAYQFYQLIQRLTLPMRKSKKVDLYHEFRRMSRLWR
jgi:hypothetical protein